MADNDILIIFIYIGEEYSFTCQKNDKLKNVCQLFATKKNLSLKKFYFLYSASVMRNKDFNKKIIQLPGVSNKEKIEILVYDNDNYNDNDNPVSEESDSNINVLVNFTLKAGLISIQCQINDKMAEIVKKFAHKAKKELNFLSFKYKRHKLDFSKSFAELADSTDKTKGIMEIEVEEINNYQRTDSINQSRNIIQNQRSNPFVQSNRPVIFIGQSPTIQTIQNGQTNLKTDNSCCNKKTIALTIGIIVTFIIIFVIIYLMVKKKASDDDPDALILDERCSQFSDSSENQECIECKEEYTLYKGKCLIYSFYAKYYINYLGEKIQLFNPDKINSIYAMEIDGQIIEPITEYIFDGVDDKIT